MMRFSLTLSSVFCLCLMLPTGAAVAKTVHIGAGHTKIVQLSGGKSYRKRLRSRKRRAAKRHTVQLHAVSVKMPIPKIAKTSKTSGRKAAEVKTVSLHASSQSSVAKKAVNAASFTSKATTPRGVYEDYVAALKAGHDTEKVMMYYTSEPKKAEMMRAIKTSAKMKEFGLKFIAKMTQCTDLTFINEKITGRKAVINYKGKDICSKKQSPYVKKTERVEMIKENGHWKIEASSTEQHDFILLKAGSGETKLQARYDPRTIYESYVYQMKKEHGFRDAAEFLTTEQKKADLLKLFKHPKEIVDQRLQAVAKSTKCTALNLVSEKIKKSKATIKYAAKEICTQNAKMDRFETVELLKVQGFWKVNKITVSNQ